MRRTGTGAMSVMAVLGLAACGEADAIRFECADGRVALVEFTENGLDMRFDGEELVHLTRAVSASGARYSDGSVTFWNKGDEAHIELGDETIEGCQVAEDQ